MIGDNADLKIQLERKRYATVAFGWKIFSPRNSRFLYTQNLFWRFTRHFSVCTSFVGGNKSNNFHRQQIRRTFFPNEGNSANRWYACDYLLQFNFNKTHIGGSVNTAVGFLSRLELKVTEKKRLKIREEKQTTPTEVTSSTSDVADEEQDFFTLLDNRDESEEQILERREQPRQDAKQCVAEEEPSSLKTSVKQFREIDGNTTS